MKLKLEKQKNLNFYCENIEKIDEYILSSFSQGNELVFKKIYRARNGEKLIIHYIKKIKTLEDLHNKEMILVFNDENSYKLATILYKLLNPKHLKIGLALAGGGARGAYQMGVLSVLENEGLLDNVSMIVGTSIGAFSMVYYKEYGIEKSKDIWCKLDSKVVLTKNTLSSLIPKGALYSREETKKFLEETVSVENIKDNPVDLYIQTMTFPKLKLKHIKINNLSKHEIINNLIATSSLPLVFGLSNIEGELCSDSGLKDNDGINFLISQGCNLIIYISLQREPKAKKKAKPGVSIIDFGSCQFYSGKVKGLVDFFPHRNKYKIEYGEQIATLMVEKLKREGLYEIIKSAKTEQFYKLDPFIRLDKTENTIKFNF